MRIFLLVLVVTLGFMRHAFASSAESKLPTLHEIKSYTFHRPYDCDGDFAQSALFLSDYSLQTRRPDLLFRGACGSERTIEASTAGDDFSVVSDLGPVPLETVSATKAMNYDRMVGHENLFKASAPVKPGHTYSVLFTKRDGRALFIVHIDSLKADGQMQIHYAVKNYSVQKIVGESPGFDWDQGNK